MRTSILMTTVAAALLAGTSLLSAQNANPGSEPKQEPKAAPKVQMNKGPAHVQGNTREKTLDKSGGNSESSAGKKPEPANRNEAAGQQNQPGAQQAPSAEPRRNAESPRQTTPSARQSRSANGAVALTAEQKTTIRQTVLGSPRAPRAANVNFSINVGTRVPSSVRLVAVPEPLFRIHPAWRGALYFVVGDEIIIVDARTHAIIAVVEV